MKIFLISGKAESGKGEVAKYIKEYLIYKHETSVITEYAKYLKRFAMELTDWDGNNDTKPRKYLQDLGKRVRNLNPEYLINNMLQDIEVYFEYVDSVIISDVRMPEEIDEIKKVHENVYSIHVENQFQASSLSVDEQSDITEVAMESYSNFDCIIVNDKLETLKDKVFKFMEEIQ